jgi:ribose transport system permease protein
MAEGRPPSSQILELQAPRLESGADGVSRPFWRTLALELVSKTVFWVALVEVALIVVFGFLSTDHVFWTLGSFRNIALDAAEVVPLAAVLATMLGAGELDISVGANIILSSVLGGKVMIALSAANPNQVANGVFPHLFASITLGLLTCLAVGMGIGAVNGLVVTRLNVNSFIATLAMLGIGTGIADIVANDVDLANIPTPLQLNFGVASLGNVLPYPALVGLVVVVLLWLLLAYTRFGLHTIALGSSREAARRAGLRVNRQLLALFMLVGGVAGLAAFIDLARFATTNIAGHQTDALAALAAAIIGGTKLFGGSVSIPGAVIGALLAVILQDGLVLIGLQNFYQLIAIGCVLIAAVHIDQRRKRLA